MKASRFAGNRRVLRRAGGPAKEWHNQKSDRILVFNTGAAQKYPEAVQEKLAHVDCTKPIDWGRI